MLTYNFDNRGKQAIYECLYQNIKEDILEGRIKPREKLPSKRSLARHLEISVITVENAYAQLMVEGYVYSVEKKGYFVSCLEERVPEPEKRPMKLREERVAREYLVDFTANSLAADNFPFSVWSRVMRRVLSEEKTELLKRVPYQGARVLREAIAQHLYQFRGMVVDPGCIVVGAGTEYLYGMLIQLLGREKVYGVEEPGYQKIGKIYEKNGVACAYIPLDSSGLSLEKLQESKAQIVHISPGHHFPTGRVMPIRRRQELLRWASQSEKRYIIEDDYDSEFRFTGRPIPAMQSIDKEEKVIYINTFSKTISPSMRISYLVLPKHLMEQYERELYFYSCPVPSFEQYTLARFIQQGYLEQHINRMRNHYRIQRDGLIRVIRESRMAGKLQIMEEDAGLHFLLKVQTERSLEEVKQIVENAKIRLSWLEDYYHEPHNNPEPVAVLNYSGIGINELKTAERILENLPPDNLAKILT